MQTSYQTCEGQRSYNLDPEKKRLPSDLDLNLMTKLILWLRSWIQGNKSMTSHLGAGF